MSNEWKELKLDKLGEDILTGSYEFAFSYDSNSIWVYHNNTSPQERINMMVKMLIHTSEVKYRKPEPKAPTHEEIMTKWWEMDNKNWERVDVFCAIRKYHFPNGGWHHAKRLTFRESADIPPEAK